MTSKSDGVAAGAAPLTAGHTPTPWRATQSNPAEGFDVWWITNADAGNYEKEIGSVAGGAPTSAANAAFIVLAVNSHHAMKEALDHLISVFERGGTIGLEDIRMARVALAKATP